MYVCQYATKYMPNPQKKIYKTETGKIFEIYLTMIFDVS